MRVRPAQSGTQLVRAADRTDRAIYVLTWFIIAFLTIAVHLVVSDEIAFADAVQYLTYTDNLYFYRSSEWFVFEPLSKATLIALRNLTGDTELTIAYAHYVITAAYLFGTLAIFRPSEGNWRGLIMAFALYGSQLAFVTVRATPAYMIAAVAVMQASRGRTRAFAFIALAVQFHISAALALVPVVALLLRAKVEWLSALQRPRALFTALIVATILFALAGPTIFSTARTIFQNIPFLGKYLVFAFGMSDAGGVSNIAGSFAIGHFVLLVAITAFMIGFLLLDDPRTRSVGIFVIVSYVMYAFIFFAFSPIAAFRQTPFWVLPAFSIFPWQRIGWKGIGQPFFLLLALGMFLYQFSRVI